MSATGTQLEVKALNALAERFGEPARDVKLNLKTVITATGLTAAQAWGTALACAYNEGSRELIHALLEDGAEFLGEGLIADAQSAAALMSMNNVYYRFRHMVGKESYNAMPARLRMTRMAKPADKLAFELFCLGVSAINGCENCIRSHESTLVQHGMAEEAIHDAIRIAAVIRSAAVTLQIY